jgi:hypothetical protein
MRRLSWRVWIGPLLAFCVTACGNTSHVARSTATPGVEGVIGTSPGATATRAATAPPRSGACPTFPADNIWNRDITQLPVDPHSAQYIASIGLGGHLHPDFGTDPTYGIPYNSVPANQPTVPVSFDYADESDAGPYPIPTNPLIEGGGQGSGDSHILMVDSGTCKLYELYAAQRQSNGSWHAGSGAIWDLRSDHLRPAGWTSSDAAGLPIFPGLVCYDEVAAGAINHALRFTVAHTQNTYIWPARHQAGDSNTAYPPMGLRLRLKANVDISSFPPQSRVILIALKHYGMMVADNGSNWFITGAPDSRWNDDDLNQLKTVPGSDFEVVNTSGLQVDPNSGQSR